MSTVGLIEQNPAPAFTIGREVVVPRYGVGRIIRVSTTSGEIGVRTYADNTLRHYDPTVVTLWGS